MHKRKHVMCRQGTLISCPRRTVRSLRDSGAVLIAVLWVCAVISWIALAYNAKARFEAEADRSRVERSQGVFLALSGAHEALARMTSQSGELLMRSGERLRPDGKAMRMDFAGGHSTVHVERELDKVNVNRAGRTELERVLQAAGYAGKAEELAFLMDANLRPKQGDGVVCSPCGPLDTIEQMALYEGVGAAMFYGEVSGGEQSSMRMGYEKTPLFDLFTVMGDRVELPVQRMGEGGADFEDGGVYRVVSVGRVSGISAAATVWLVVKLSSNARYGYELLYRKIL